MRMRAWGVVFECRGVQEKRSPRVCRYVWVEERERRDDGMPALKAPSHPLLSHFLLAGRARWHLFFSITISYIHPSLPPSLPPFPPVSGILKGFDQLINLVLDESKETIRGTYTELSLPYFPYPFLIPFPLAIYFLPPSLPPSIHPSLPPDPTDPYRLTEETRDLGLVICRGTQVSLISPVEGTEEIANPFIQGEDEA